MTVISNNNQNHLMMNRKYVMLLSALMLAFGCTHTTKQGDQKAATETSNSGEEIAYYTCSMHSQVHKDKPGKCPICGMKLVPVMKSELQSGDAKTTPGMNMNSGKPDSSMQNMDRTDSSSSMRGMDMKNSNSSMNMQDVAKLTLTPHQQFMAGVRLDTVKVENIHSQIILTGKTIFN